MNFPRFLKCFVVFRVKLNKIDKIVITKSSDFGKALEKTTEKKKISKVYFKVDCCEAEIPEIVMGKFHDL
jgi:glycosylphosphatidylinositol transamidase (GPIT) subunit GPI8